jgi:serine/threonine-protein kinase
VSAESAPADKLIGQILAERYHILHRLGEGAMGTVYKARHVKVGRSFAVKVLHARLLEDPKIALRFDREAELAGRLRHANVIGVVDVGELDGMHYMVMDYAEGPDLARLLVEAPMPAERIIRLVRQMLEGLYHAHEQGLIHRDFKPENVIIERDTHGAEMPRIVDFGIAILRDGGDSVDGEGRLTTNGLVLGTPHYMAPEQAVADPIDHRIDLFALGIVVYEMLCGQLPFDGSGAEIARANVMNDPPPIAERVPYLEVDPLLEAFARRLMAKSRNARPATAKAARELLDLIDRDRPAAAAALGVLPAMSVHAPAATQSVPPQDRGSSRAEPPPMEPAQLRASPSPSRPIRPPARPARRASEAALPPGPIALRAPGPPDAPPQAKALGDDETAIQTSPGWPPASKRKRGPWVVAGAALGTAGIFAAWLLARTGTKQDTPATTARIVMTPVPSNTPTAGSARDPAVADPALTSPEAPDPNATDPTRTDPKSTGGPSGPTTTNRDKATHRNKATHRKTTDTNVSIKHISRADTTPRESRAATPEAPLTTGTTPGALSALYYAIPPTLSRLPKDEAQDLFTRWRRFNVQALMAGPQPERDQAADQLSQILREARLLLKKSGKSAPQR